MESTHLYLDEAGNFDFGPNGTRWLVLTCVKIPWDSQRIAHLAQLRHDLLLEGIGLEYFHASEDNRRVRQRFLGKIAPWLPPSSVKARALLKQDIDERLRAPERFYPAFVGPLVERHIGQGNERVWVFRTPFHSTKNVMGSRRQSPPSWPRDRQGKVHIRSSTMPPNRTSTCKSQITAAGRSGGH